MDNILIDTNQLEAIKNYLTLYLEIGTYEDLVNKGYRISYINYLRGIVKRRNKHIIRS